MSSQDPDIVLVTPPLECQICYHDIGKLSAPARQRHYDQHFQVDVEPSDSPHAGPSTASSPTNGQKRKRRLKFAGKFKEESEDAFWYATLTTPPPGNYTPGMIPLLKSALTKSHASGKTRRAVLCYDKTVHIGRSWDLGWGWGCGYRCFMTVCTAIMDQSVQPQYKDLLSARLRGSLGIRTLQQLIEDAWSAGFDHEGAKELHPLLGTSKWIGTADLSTAFSFCGIPTQLVDFELPKGSNKPLVDWTMSYFKPDAPTPAKSVNEALRGASPVVVLEKMPFILQHQGHSRVIVGYELFKGDKINLLTFDSSRTIPKSVRAAGLTSTCPELNTIIVATTPSKPQGQSNGLSRLGSGSQPIAVDDEDEVLLVGSESEDEIQILGEKAPRAKSGAGRTTDVSPGDVIKAFRLDTKNLTHRKYQVLYFPMTRPMTDAEKMQAKVVKSQKIS